MKKDCDICGLEYRKLVQHKDKMICKKCQKKELNMIGGPIGPTIFNEYVTRQRQVFLSLTKSQEIFLEKRGKQFGRKNDYIRALINMDMEQSGAKDE